MSVIAVIGDPHIGRSLSIGKPGVGNALNSRVIDQISLLDWSLDQCVENDVETIIIAGDIFHDSRPDYRFVNLFIKFLKNCEFHNIEVDIIFGNHDIKRSGAYYTSVLDIIKSMDIPAVHVHGKPKTIHKKGLSFTLFPFRDRSSLGCKTNTEAINKIKETLPFEVCSIPPENDKILLGHLGIEGSLYTGEFDNYANELMCPLDMFSDYDYVWMGHIHTPQVLSKNPYIAHVGSLDITDFGEEDQEKHIIIFNSEDKDKFKKIKLPTRPLRHISIEVPGEKDATDFVIEKIDVIHNQKSLEKAIVRIEIKLMDENMENVDREKVEKHIYGLKAFYICNFSESRNVVVVPLSQQSLVDNTISHKEAIKLYAEKEDFSSEQDKERYIDKANYIVEKYGS